MAPRSDVDFTFGADAFIAGIKKVGKSFQTLTKGIADTTKKSTKKIIQFFKDRRDAAKKTGDAIKAVNKGTFAALAKIALIGTAIVASFRFARNAINEFIPEVSKTFGIARDIILRNLLFPLRKQLLPALQNLLNWVRKNRELFTQFGVVLVNVFKLVKTTFKAILNLVKPIFNQFKQFFTDLLGDTRKSITETINLAIFKLTTLVIAMQTLLQPIFDTLGEVFGKTIKIIKVFTTELVKGFTEIFEASDTISDVNEILTELGKTLDKITPALKVFGRVVGRTFGVVLKSALTILKAMVITLNALLDTIAEPERYKEIFSNLGKTLGSEFKDLGTTAFAGLKQNAGDVAELATGERPEFAKVDDAIITKEGKIIKTNPQDNIIATKGGAGGNQIEINMGGIAVTVTEGNARQAGENLADGMMDRIRVSLRNELLTEGSI
jgi:hypothetical protein